eukprot:CAMPEP_0171054310 /NCGR_PEP_ID=MMETSP0736-20130129/55032_1 /TAXON_ID=186038 /ORGANISM="Fragilariopsis kerguelensis, Strain L26-C5" /LENGTH=43 /DNA_ID= /DNA_START= /DNA_END= /DNA_ORIENTATION=
MSLPHEDDDDDNNPRRPNQWNNKSSYGGYCEGDYDSSEEDEDG